MAFLFPHGPSTAAALGGTRQTGEQVAVAAVSVQEALASLLPAAGRAPQVSVLHAVHLPALLALSPRLPADR